MSDRYGMIYKPMRVSGVEVTRSDLIGVANEFADAPMAFVGMDLARRLPSEHGLHWQQEVINRLLQRWRKLDLVYFGRGRWYLRRGAWGVIQNAMRLPAPPAQEGRA